MLKIVTRLTGFRPLRRLCPEFLLVLLTFCSSGLAEPSPPTRSLDQWERRLTEIDARLAALPNYTIGAGIGPIGYRSLAHDSADQPEWIEINFGREVALDEIVIVPTIRRDAVAGFQSDAFPTAMRIITGQAGDHDGRVVADSGVSRYILNGTWRS